MGVGNKDQIQRNKKNVNMNNYNHKCLCVCVGGVKNKLVLITGGGTGSNIEPNQ